MLDMELINETIKELENGPTTFEACNKLASLYSIKTYYNRNDEDNIEKELDDILPQYKHYCDAKIKYQMHNATEDLIIYEMEILCKEIREFIQTLYSGTDTDKERHILLNMLGNLNVAFHK